MARPFAEFVDRIRLSQTLQEESYHMRTEQAEMRAYIKKPDPALRPRVVSKLLFIDIMGENASFGQMEAMNLMAESRYSYKRVGYICAAQLLDSMTEVSVLVTQTLLQDLKNPDVRIQNLALVFIANLGNPEVCRVVAAEVRPLMESKVMSVRKYAGMAIARIVRTNPDLATSYKNAVQGLLNSPSHGVLLSGINLVITLLSIEQTFLSSWSQFSIPFTRVLKQLTTKRPPREFSYGAMNDPFLQIKAMKAISDLKNTSDELEKILQSVVGGVDTQRNLGRAVLYQAVDTIIAVTKNASLRGLALNQVGRLLTMTDANALYTALCSFGRVLCLDDSTVNRGNIDSMALQRYKTHVVKCLDHADPSIRRRALDVISALIDANNVETLVPEMLTYLALADAEFRVELVTKVYAAVERFAPSPVWRFDTIRALIIESGDYVTTEIISSFTEMIAKAPGLQAHAVEKLSESFRRHSENQTLLQVSAFIVGEFATADNGVCSDMRQILVMPQTKIETQCYIMTALAKMIVKLGDMPENMAVIAELVTHNHLEIQQRAGEIMKLLGSASVHGDFLAPISATAEYDEAEELEAGGKLGMVVGSQGPTAEDEAGDDLLSLMLESQEPQKTDDNLIGLLGSLSSLAPASTTMTMPSPSVVARPPQNGEMARMTQFAVYGQTQANPSNPKMTALCLTVRGIHAELTNFVMKYNAGPGWQIQVQPAKGATASEVHTVTQLVYLLDQGTSPFQLHVMATYQCNRQPGSDTFTLTSFPLP